MGKGKRTVMFCEKKRFFSHDAFLLSSYMSVFFLLLHRAFLKFTDYHTPTNALLYIALV